jgi:hypothetical protein
VLKEMIGIVTSTDDKRPNADRLAIQDDMAQRVTSALRESVR